MLEPPKATPNAQQCTVQEMERLGAEMSQANPLGTSSSWLHPSSETKTYPPLAPHTFTAFELSPAAMPDHRPAGPDVSQDLPIPTSTISALDVSQGDNLSLKILFHHCPKTAGTSFTEFLEDEYSINKVLRVSDPSQLRSPAVIRYIRRQNIKCVSGHIHPNFKIGSGAYKRISFLRRPEDLAISAFCYAYQRRFDAYSRAKFFRSRGKGGNFDVKDVLAFFKEYYRDNPQTRFFSSTTDGSLTEAHLETAVEEIKNLDFVGIQERMADSLDVLRALFDLKTHHIWNSNTSDHSIVKASVDDLRSIVRQIMPLDVELYEVAKALLLEQERLVADRVRASIKTTVYNGNKRDGLGARILRWRVKKLTQWRSVGFTHMDHVAQWRSGLPGSSQA